MPLHPSRPMSRRSFSSLSPLAQIPGQLLHNFLSVALPTAGTAKITKLSPDLFKATICINESLEGTGTGRSMAIARQNARLDATHKLLPLLKPQIPQLPKTVAQRMQEIEMLLQPEAPKEPSLVTNEQFKEAAEAEAFISRFCSTNNLAFPIVTAVQTANSAEVIAKATIFLKGELCKEGKDVNLIAIATVASEAGKCAKVPAKQAARVKLANQLHAVVKDAQELAKPAAEPDRFPELDFSFTAAQREALSSFVQHWAERIPTAEHAEHTLNSQFDRNLFIDQPIEYAENDSFAKATLPVHEHYTSIVQAIRENQVTLITGATGSGKTTQIPQFILNAFPKANVLMTQPRRVAAFAAAERISQELGEQLGDSVGYSVRFEGKKPSKREGTVLVCTAGVLLKRLSSSDSMLRGVSHLVVDEVHERDVTTDLLLARIKHVLKARPHSFRVVLMSATLVASQIAAYFKSDGFSVASAFEVAGTLHPIREHFLPDILQQVNARLCAENDTNTKNFLKDPTSAEAPVPHALIAQLTKNCLAKVQTGSILVFLPGIEDINEVKRMLGGIPYSIYCLHSGIGVATEDAKSLFFVNPAATSAPAPKVILATNVAESSVTVPDAVCVIDAGRHRVLRYCHRRRMSLLQTEWISRANHTQRKGRAGRTRAGDYFFVGNRETLSAAAPTLEPEVMRVCLESVCLTIRRLFPDAEDDSIEDLLCLLIDAPKREVVRKAIYHLKLIGALDTDERIAGKFGEILSDLPVDPAMGKLLVAGALFGRLEEALVLVTSLSERIFRPSFSMEHQSRPLPEPKSSHLATCSLVTQYNQQSGFGGAQSFCMQHNLNPAALRRMQQIKIDLLKALEQKGLNAGNSVILTRNSQSPLFSLMILLGNFPSVAWKRAGRKGTLCTKTLGYAGLSGCSSTALKGLESGLYAFDSVIDTTGGRPLLNRATRVSPIELLVAAPSQVIQQQESGVCVDGWIRVGKRDFLLQDYRLVVALGDLIRRYLLGLRFDREFVQELEKVLAQVNTVPVAEIVQEERL